MNLHFGFSYTGLIYLLLLFVPNMVWAKHKPQGYDEYVKNENKILKIFESAGQVFVSCFVLIFRDFNIILGSRWIGWLICSAVFMLLYEVFWFRYFKSKKTMRDFYSSLLGIPVAGATLPVIAFLLLAVYGKNPFLFAAVILLGIGHIGIHINHKKET